MSQRLLDAETRYPELEKLALALVVMSKKLTPYFHAHLIEVLTNYPLRQVLQKLGPQVGFLSGQLSWGNSM